MGIIKVNVSDEVEDSFRRAAMRRFGYRKGAISVAAQKAIKEWAVINLGSERKHTEDPVEAISGLMKNVKKTSVELQHEVGRILTEKHARRR